MRAKQTQAKRKENYECEYQQKASGHCHRGVKRIGLGITGALLEHGYRVVANSRTISKSKI